MYRCLEEMVCCYCRGVFEFGALLHKSKEIWIIFSGGFK